MEIVTFAAKSLKIAVKKFITKFEFQINFLMLFTINLKQLEATLSQ